MKTYVVLFAVSLIMCIASQALCNYFKFNGLTVWADELTPVGEYERGPAILNESWEAYKKLNGHSVDVKVTSTVSFKGQNKTFSEKRLFVAEYGFPNNLLLSGKDSNGDIINFEIRDGKCVQFKCTGCDGERASMNMPKDASLALGGVTLGLSVIGPSLYLGFNWDQETIYVSKGEFLPSLSKLGKFAGRETVEGKVCDVVACKTSMFTTTVYVEEHTRLLTRLVRSINSEQMSKQREKGFGGASGRMESSTLTISFLPR